MRVASIDIGTNTILLLIADIDSKGELAVLADVHEIGRLGEGIDAERRIMPAAIERCQAILTRYREIIDETKVDVIRAVGTSAVRDAANRDEFVSAMLRSTGIGIEVLSGDEEARWSYAGAVSGLPLQAARAVVLDIGGGSTELIVGDGSRIHAHRSLDIGAVRLTQKFGLDSPPADEKLADCERYIAEQVRAYPEFDAGDATFVGVAGTVTTLAAIEQGLRAHDASRIAGYSLSITRIEARYEEMRRMSHEGLVRELGIAPKRADVIVAGMAILLGVLRARGVPRVVVSERGLRYGIALREAPPA
jgi:exopolyphosphatase/guanosine-5'-triphosphate,3'-diphosphate pyrophosphatase